MALGLGNFSFLKKTAGAAGGVQAQGGVAQNAGVKADAGVPAELSGANKVGEQQADTTKMSTSQWLNDAYGNKAAENKEGQQAGSQDHKSDKAIVLPYMVEYNNEKFPSRGQDVDKVAAEIAMKTGESKSKVASELKKKYANSGFAKTGMKLNMSA